MTTYSVKSNRCGCHPETCCCNDYAVVDEDGKKYSTFFGEADAHEVARLLNERGRLQQSLEKADACVAPMSDKLACGVQNAECETQRGAVTISDALLSFLHGSGEIDGVWFGDKHPKYPGRFWWRALLPQPGEAQPASGEDARDAERYRWLRDNNGVPGGHEVGVFIDGEAHAPGHLCAQIDQAMQQEPQP